MAGEPVITRGGKQNRSIRGKCIFSPTRQRRGSEHPLTRSWRSRRRCQGRSGGCPWPWRWSCPPSPATRRGDAGQGDKGILNYTHEARQILHRWVIYTDADKWILKHNIEPKEILYRQILHRRFLYLDAENGILIHNMDPRQILYWRILYNDKF